MAQEFNWPVRVYIEDTDAGEIVYYVNYLKYMERARTEFLRHIGFDHAQMMRQGNMFVIHAAEVNYSAPAYLDDALLISVRPCKLKRTQVSFEQKVVRETDGRELVHARIQGVWVTRNNMKPCAIAPDLAQALDAYC